MKSREQKTTATILFTVAALPLLLYPMVLIANLMSIAAFSTGGEGIIIPVIFCFMLVTTLYPVTYGIAVYKYTRKDNASLKYVFWPYWHFLLAVVLMFMWGFLE